MSADIFNQGCRGNLRNDLGVIPGMYNDSGVESSEYLQQRYLDIPPKSESDSIPELEEVLSKLTPEDLEKRRRMFSVGRFSFDLGSDGYESPGSALMGHPGFKFMPYGVRTPDSLMSTGSREWTGSSGNYLRYLTWGFSVRIQKYPQVNIKTVRNLFFYSFFILECKLGNL